MVTSQIKDILKNAIQVFARNNKNCQPTDIFIYRDGVSAAERGQVIDRELAQFNECFNECYN